MNLAFPFLFPAQQKCPRRKKTERGKGPLPLLLEMVNLAFVYTEAATTMSEWGIKYGSFPLQRYTKTPSTPLCSQIGIPWLGDKVDSA